MLLLGLLACAPAPVTPRPPEAPVLEGDGTLVSDFRWMLKGAAPADTIVRLYVDESCAGPSLRDLTSDALAQGVTMELVGGAPNVFSAVSIDARGLSSACSAPIRVTYQRPPRPRGPQAQFRPPLPTRETHFEIWGTATDAIAVQLIEGFSCSGFALAELTVAEFRDVGFSVDVPPNGSRVFVLQSLNELRETSACSSPLTLVSDQTPPSVRPSILSPMPSPERSAYVAISYDAAFGTVFLGPDCVGPVLSTCSGYACTGFPVEFPMASMSSWSATAVDTLGNRSSCVNGFDSWLWDPLAPAPQLELIVRPGDQSIHGSVPASHAWVEIFDGPSCDPDHLRARISGALLAGAGYDTGQFQVPSDGGVLVAQGLSLDLMTVYPCSQPVPWPGTD